MQNHQINIDLLEEIPSKLIIRWKPFSEEEFTSFIVKYNNSLTSGPNKLSWRHLKIIVKDVTCLRNLINIADTCIKLGHWLSHFKTLSSIIIPKPNKAFKLIVLLNMLGKIFGKVIGEKLQFQLISKFFI